MPYVGGPCYGDIMTRITATVKGGQLTGIDDVELPDGEVVYVAVHGHGDTEPTAAERLELDAALAAAGAAGGSDWIPAERVVRRS